MILKRLSHSTKNFCRIVENLMVKTSNVSFKIKSKVEYSDITVLGVKPAITNNFCHDPSQLLLAAYTVPCKNQQLKVKRNLDCKRFINLTYHLPNETQKRIFDLRKFGCPIIVKNGQALRLNLELWINNKFFREIDEEYVLHEINNRRGFKVRFNIYTNCF